MAERLFYIDPDSRLGLQAQIRHRLVEAMHLGVFKPGARLPSSRTLADQLGVARNTVVLACQQLVAEGLLTGRPRSGLYVAHRAAWPSPAVLDPHERAGITGRWQQWLKARANPDTARVAPADARSYPYCFLDGQFDASLFPVAEWREACRYALASGDIEAWSGAGGGQDDPMLIEELRTKILPMRGITARADEILITVGAQQALYLVAELLVDSSVSVAIEEPGYPAMRHLLNRRGAPIVHQPIDGDGLLVDSTLDGCRIVYVTPSHQAATGVTMSLPRRRALLEKASQRDMLVIEDDFDCESNYKGYPHPALRGMDRENRVIYVSTLTKLLAPGLRLGYIVAAPELIAEARKLRSLMVGHPPRNNQRAMAHFIRLGHYDALTRSLHATFGRRWEALRNALNFYLPPWVALAPSHGGTVLWVQGSDALDVARVVTGAARRGCWSSRWTTSTHCRAVRSIASGWAFPRFPRSAFGPAWRSWPRWSAGSPRSPRAPRHLRRASAQGGGPALDAARCGDHDPARLWRTARDTVGRRRVDERAGGAPRGRPGRGSLVDRRRPVRPAMEPLVIRGGRVLCGRPGRHAPEVLPGVGLYRGCADLPSSGQ